MDSSSVIHLLVLVESSHDAEVIASSIRNAGHAVRSKHIQDGEDLVDALQAQSWDLLISAPSVGEHSAQQAIATITQQGKDLPCIVYGPQLDKSTNLQLLQAGAAVCVAAEQHELFILQVEREVGHLAERRAYRSCRNALTESEKRNRTLLDSSRDAICYIHEGMHIYANLSYLEAFGYEDAEEMESTPIMDLISTDHQPAFKELLRTLSKGETPKEGFEFEAERSNGDKFKAVMVFSPASIDGEPCTQVVIQQQGDNAKLERELEKLRKQDLLTGLYNRQYFMDELSRAVATASQGKGTSVLFYIEVDNFKAIKDTLGIAGSDIILTDIATLLQQNLDDEALIARFAGTIFTIIFFDKTLDQMEPVAEAIRAEFESHIFEVEGKTISTTCSIGVAPIIETTPDAKKVLTNADASCTLAKTGKGNKVHIHTIADELAGLEEDRAWAERIRLALKNNRFVLHFQPIVSLHAEPAARYEALIRMLGDKGELILPGKFIKAAETAQLMIDIDRWVMKTAAKAMLEKRKEGKDIRFFIKLSNDSLEDPTLLPWISKLLTAARIHGTSFVFEVSEAAALNNIKSTKALANGLHELNCLFALDHVGNDNPTLNYLSHFDVDFLKIDGANIKNLTSNDASQDLVKNITEIARGKDILTIAEHVQDPACLAMLWQHGINLIQGHYFQKPEDNLSYDFTAE